MNISSRLVVSLFYFFKNLQLHISVILVICTNIGLIFCADDIIATGGTMALAIEIAKKTGAKSLYAVGTHPLLIKNAVYTLLKAGTTEIIGTDTLESSAMQTSMAKLIAQAIQNH